MGNILSNFFDDQKITDTNKLEPRSVRQIVDYIATYYILTMDFNSLKKLYDIEYCDKLVILTSDIIDRYFTDLQITYLAEKIKSGDNLASNRESNLDTEFELEKDKMIFFNKDDLNDLDIKDPNKKKQVCVSISKFYIKIAHVFATILTTINPVYVYKDENGRTNQANIYNKSKIPKGAIIKMYKLNICDNRINALKRVSELDFSNINDRITIHPKICSFNINPIEDEDENENENEDEDEDENENEDLKNLGNEPGIPELMELYYDDNYDYRTGKFRGMSSKTRAVFNENLRHFYMCLRMVK
jgi:hypothetical protein